MGKGPQPTGEGGVPSGLQARPIRWGCGFVFFCRRWCWVFVDVLAVFRWIWVVREKLGAQGEGKPGTRRWWWAVVWAAQKVGKRVGGEGEGVGEVRVGRLGSGQWGAVVWGVVCVWEMLFVECLC